MFAVYCSIIPYLNEYASSHRVLLKLLCEIISIHGKLDTTNSSRSETCAEIAQTLRLFFDNVTLTLEHVRDIVSLMAPNLEEITQPKIKPLPLLRHLSAIAHLCRLYIGL